MATSEERPAIVFIPGFMQSGGAWAPVADLLPERYPSLLLRHGADTYEGRLKEIAACGKGAVLAGYSMGGRLALHAALRHPGHFAGLVTIGTAAGIEAPGARTARGEADEKLASWMETQPIDAIVSIWERQPLFADQSDALVASQRADRLTQDPRGLATLLRTAGQGALEPVWQRLHTLDVPLLAIAGDRDELYCQAAARMARAVPHGRAARVEAAGHAAHLQQPREVAGLLAEFLDEHFGQRAV